MNSSHFSCMYHVPLIAWSHLNLLGTGKIVLTFGVWCFKCRVAAAARAFFDLNAYTARLCFPVRTKRMYVWLDNFAPSVFSRLMYAWATVSNLSSCLCILSTLLHCLLFCTYFNICMMVTHKMTNYICQSVRNSFILRMNLLNSLSTLSLHLCATKCYHHCCSIWSFQKVYISIDLWNAVSS